MNIEVIEEFLFWCMIINMGIYTFSTLVILALRDFIYKIHMMLFKINQDTVHETVYAYLAGYKLLIIFFNFVPWFAIWIIK